LSGVYDMADHDRPRREIDIGGKQWCDAIAWHDKRLAHLVVVLRRRDQSVLVVVLTTLRPPEVEDVPMGGTYVALKPHLNKGHFTAARSSQMVLLRRVIGWIVARSSVAVLVSPGVGDLAQAAELADVVGVVVRHD